MTPDVTVYTSASSGRCTALKSDLVDLGVTYTEIDVTTDAAAARLVDELGGDVPVVVLPDGTRLVTPQADKVYAELVQLRATFHNETTVSERILS